MSYGIGHWLKNSSATDAMRSSRYARVMSLAPTFGEVMPDDTKPGVETFWVAHEEDLGLNEDISVGDQRGGEPSGLADRCWRAEHRTSSLPVLDPDSRCPRAFTRTARPFPLGASNRSTRTAPIPPRQARLRDPATCSSPVPTPPRSDRIARGAEVTSRSRELPMPSGPRSARSLRALRGSGSAPVQAAVEGHRRGGGRGGPSVPRR